MDKDGVRFTVGAGIGIGGVGLQMTGAPPWVGWVVVAVGVAVCVWPYAVHLLNPEAQPHESNDLRDATHALKAKAENNPDLRPGATLAAMLLAHIDQGQATTDLASYAKWEDKVTLYLEGNVGKAYAKRLEVVGRFFPSAMSPFLNQKGDESWKERRLSIIRELGVIVSEIRNH